MKNIILFLLTSLLFQVQIGAAQTKPEKFEIGKQTFLLNGEPFVVKAAEMHYPRIPKPY